MARTSTSWASSGKGNRADLSAPEDSGNRFNVFGQLHAEPSSLWSSNCGAALDGNDLPRHPPGRCMYILLRKAFRARYLPRGAAPSVERRRRGLGTRTTARPSAARQCAAGC